MMMTWAMAVVLAATLPGFEDFRRADRERRESGQWQTESAAALTQVDAKAVAALAEERPGDAALQWGAAELLTEWPARRARFEAALGASGTNSAIALRFGCAAAEQRETETALRWLRYCQQRDADNAVPWLAEWWLTRAASLPTNATVFADHAAEAARARIQLLETMGYSPYAARRIGYTVGMPVLPMMRDAARQMSAAERGWLLPVARAMQQGATFVILELVGQSVENILLAGESTTAAADRVADLKVRREELTALTREVGLTVVDGATEGEMVRYFDEMLARGEEAAMRQLARTVRGGR